jgi:transposase
MGKTVSFGETSVTVGYDTDEQKNAIGQRRRVHRMHFVEGLSKTQIARQTGLSKQFVVDWTRSASQDLQVDRRGWPMGQARLWDETTRRRIQKMYRELERSPHEFYSGATAIAQRYRRRFPGEPVPSLRTIGRMLKELGLSRSPKKRAKGAARYLCYPEHSVYETLGARLLEADFIGQKYLVGRTAPLHFVGMSFKKSPKLRHFYRVEAATTEALIGACEDFFRRFEIPDVMKVDNAQATIGTGSGRRCLSRFMVFLLKQKIIPVYSVPRKPFSQASIEGNNSVFARKFWRSTEFSSLRQVDTRLQWFNDSSLAYTGYDTTKRRRRSSKKTFVPKVYFIRQVRQDEYTGRGYIDVLNETVPIRKNYINYFVLAQWNLNDEQLRVYFEKDQSAKVIKTIDFTLNPNSKYQLK